MSSTHWKALGQVQPKSCREISNRIRISASVQSNEEVKRKKNLSAEDLQRFFIKKKEKFSKSVPFDKDGLEMMFSFLLTFKSLKFLFYQKSVINFSIICLAKPLASFLNTFLSYNKTRKVNQFGKTRQDGITHEERNSNNFRWRHETIL